MWKYPNLRCIHGVGPRPLEEILSASSFRQLQREFSLVPELVWAGALRVCDQSTVNAPEPCRADLGSQPAAVSWAAVAVGWRSDSQGCARRHRHNNPHFPNALPRLDTRPHAHPSWPYHDSPKLPHAATRSPGTRGGVWERRLFKRCGEWLGDKVRAQVFRLPRWSDSYLASSANVALGQRWQHVLVS